MNEIVEKIREYANSLPETVWTHHGRKGEEIDNPDRRRLLDLLEVIDSLKTDAGSHLPVGVFSEYSRLDVMWQELVRERDAAVNTAKAFSWQPISTFPQDGSNVLVTRFQNGKPWFVTQGSWIGGICHSVALDYATHWAPIPTEVRE